MADPVLCPARASHSRSRHATRRKPLDDPFVVDHVVPRARGGSDEASNLAVAHQSCNARKGADAKADVLRAELRQAMARAKADGVTVSAMSRALGVSRQRVQQILGRLDRA
jgi:5-methylcytosine-specific restriction endonuclease McrA